MWSMPTILAALRHDVNVTDSKPRRLRAAELFALVCARLTDVRMVVSGGGWRVAHPSRDRRPRALLTAVSAGRVAS
jgi:hypothetical protein